MNPKSVQFEPYRDNSMGNDVLRFTYSFGGFNFPEARAISEESIRLAAKLAGQLEQDLKEFK